MFHRRCLSCSLGLMVVVVVVGGACQSCLGVKAGSHLRQVTNSSKGPHRGTNNHPRPQPRVANDPNVDVFGLGENPHRCQENPEWESNSQPSCCESIKLNQTSVFRPPHSLPSCSFKRSFCFFLFFYFKVVKSRGVFFNARKTYPHPKNELFGSHQVMFSTLRDF